jgi:hypothetical protein
MTLFRVDSVCSTGSSAVERTVRIGAATYPLVLPNRRDPRLHLASVIISIHVLGQTAFEFNVSVPQILAAMLTSALIEVAITFRLESRLVWPASALLTGSGVGLILRATGTEASDHWSFHRWYLFSGVAALSLLTKYVVRWGGRHVFNPSNIGLVIAFVMLGSSRVEPLEFWWAPFDVWMLTAYAVILVGGVLITRGLKLFAMGLTFWLSLAFGTGVLALSGHSITTNWSVIPISGMHFWWTIVSSPEVLIFLFFMLTDPRTVPGGRVARVAFGAVVGLSSTLLLAPWHTEFGVKVGLLAGLAILSPFRFWLERHLPVAGSDTDRPRGFFVSVFGDRGMGRRPSAGRAVVIAACISPLVIVAVTIAGWPARSSTFELVAADVPDASTVVAALDPAALPATTADPAAIELFGDLADPARAEAIALTFLWDLEVEAEAFRRGDAELLRAVAHGSRLIELLDRLERRSDSRRPVTTYSFDSLRLVVVRLGGQSGPLLGVEGTGRENRTILDGQGNVVSSVAKPFKEVFALRPLGDQRWLIAGTRPVPG